MTTFYFKNSPFLVKKYTSSTSSFLGEQGYGCQLGFAAVPNKLQSAAPIMMIVGSFKGGNTSLNLPSGLYFKNRHINDSLRNIILTSNGSLLPPHISLVVPLGTTTRGIKARDPTGAIWYLQVRASNPP